MEQAEMRALAEQATVLSFYNVEMLESTPRVGCYSCIRTFDAGEVVERTDDGATALCPHCGIDAIVPYDDTALLMCMCERWFTGRSHEGRAP